MAKRASSEELKPENFETPYAYECAKEEMRLAERVEIRLPKDNENYKDDVTVCVNGVTYLIQRGVPVMVPRQVAEILRQSEHQAFIAEEKSAAAANVYLGER